MLAAVDQDQTEWYDVWGKLKSAAADLDSAVAELQSRRSYAMSRPELAADYNSQMSDIESARSRVTWLRDTIRSVLGAFGVQLDGLGFVPLIPIAVVTAGVAYIANLAASAWSLTKRIDEQQRLEAQGMTPQQASAIITRNAEAGTLTGAIKEAVPALVVLGVGLAAWWWYTHRGSHG